MQLRANTTIRSARLDVNGPHTNPNVDYHVSPDDPFYGIHDGCIGKMFRDEPHVHIYREGFEDRWAYPIADIFDDTGGIDRTFYEFMNFCAIRGNLRLQGF